MNKIIKVTSAGDDRKPTYMFTDKLESFHGSPTGSYLYTGSDDGYYSVKESPEEIIALLFATKNLLEEGGSDDTRTDG